MRNRQLYKWIAYACIFLLVFLLQTTALSRLEVMGVHPNLIPVLVVCVALFEGAAGGAAFGFAAGFYATRLFRPPKRFLRCFSFLWGSLRARCATISLKSAFLPLFYGR